MEEPTAKCQGTSGAQGIPDVGILEDSLEIFTCHINGESHMDFFKHGRATLKDQITSHPGWETLEQILVTSWQGDTAGRLLPTLRPLTLQEENPPLS